MKLPTYKAVGVRGAWFAKVNGERLPCVHQYWIKGTKYRAIRTVQNGANDKALVSAIKGLKKVVVTKDDVFDEGCEFWRTGYVAVFSIDNIDWRGGELTFDLIERLADLK